MAINGFAVHYFVNKICEKSQKPVTPFLSGFLDGGTQEQGDFLGEFWSDKLKEVEGAASAE